MRPRKTQRLLCAVDRTSYPLFYAGGTEQCTHRLLQGLVKEYSVEVLWLSSLGGVNGNAAASVPPEDRWPELGVRAAYPDGSDLVFDIGYPVKVVRQDYFLSLHAAVREFRPDAVLTYQDGALRVTEIARAHGIRTCWYLHDVEPRFNAPETLRAAAALKADFWACSPYVKRMAKTRANIRARVIFPFVDVDRYAVVRTPRYVTFVNPSKQKGVDVFLKIARQASEIPFLLVEGWPLSLSEGRALREALKRLPNVTFRRRQSDMRKVYAQTRLLLVPSQWEESFCRVALEAQASGIPVVCSARGFLPQLGGGTRVVIQDGDARSYVSVLRQIWGDSEQERRLSEAARQNSRRDRYSIAANLDIAHQSLFGRP
jgi:glycosyltransferase involved in cell wall biosynthesis